MRNSFFESAKNRGDLPIKRLQIVCCDVEKGTIKMKKCVYLFFCCAIAGCTSVAQLEQQLGRQWIGKDGDSLISSKGAPDKVVDDGPGGQILCYVKITSYTMPFRESMRPIIYTSKKGLHYNAQVLSTADFYKGTKNYVLGKSRRPNIQDFRCPVRLRNKSGEGCPQNFLKRRK
jgi:hypothetical protein